MDGIDVIKIQSDYHPRWRGYRSIYNPPVIGEVKRIMKDFAPDIVHAHNLHFHLSYYSLVLARRYAKQIYLTVHDADAFYLGKFIESKKLSFWRLIYLYKWRYNPFRNIILRHILSHNVDAIVAVSDALRRALNGHGIKKVAVIHNGIDLGDWQRPLQYESFKNTYGLGDSVILFGGRLSGLKGAINIIEALKISHGAVPDVQLMIIGKKDAYAEKMLVLARKLGVADRIIFTDWIAGEELRAAYYAAAVVTVPSVYLDPFPTVNLEAFACSKPVVATCFGGSPEIVLDNVCGYIVDPSDISAMSIKINDLLIDKEKATRFGQAGYARVTKDFSLSSQVEAYERIFKIL